MEQAIDTVSLPVYLKGDESQAIGMAFATPNHFLGGVSIEVKIRDDLNTSGMYNELQKNKLHLAAAPTRLTMHIRHEKTGELITSVATLMEHDRKEYDKRQNS